MAPLIDAGQVFETPSAFVIALAVLGIVCILAVSSVIMCGCCEDDRKKRVQEEADANVPPPPSAPVSIYQSQQLKGDPSAEPSSEKGGRGGKGSPTGDVPSGIQKSSPGKNQTLADPPKGRGNQDGAAPMNTLAFANSNVFDRDGKKPAGGKGPAPTLSAPGFAPETLALANSNVFGAASGQSGKQPKGKSPAPTLSAPGFAPETLALANSNVFGAASGKSAPKGRRKGDVPPANTMALANSNVFSKR